MPVALLPCAQYIPAKPTKPFTRLTGHAAIDSGVPAQSPEGFPSGRGAHGKSSSVTEYMASPAVILSTAGAEIRHEVAEVRRFQRRSEQEQFAWKAASKEERADARIIYERSISLQPSRSWLP